MITLSVSQSEAETQKIYEKIWHEKATKNLEIGEIEPELDLVHIFVIWQ